MAVPSWYTLERFDLLNWGVTEVQLPNYRMAAIKAGQYVVEGESDAPHQGGEMRLGRQGSRRSPVYCARGSNSTSHDRLKLVELYWPVRTVATA